MFDPAMHDVVLDRLDLETDLRRAVSRGELRLDYQPEVDLASGEIVGVEALLRWDHPRRGLLGPGEFLPLAEETGLILPIGEWLLGEACRQVQAWHRLNLGRPPLVVSVNLSPRQFQQSDLPGRVDALLRELSLPPSCLQVEITESILMGAESASEWTIDRLRALGVRLAIDDFGTGYSSLSCLRRFPVDTLKIDGSLVAAIDGDAMAMAIARAIATLGRELGMQITAEGIENTEQLEQVRAIGCHNGQGDHFAAPLPALRVSALLGASTVPRPRRELVGVA